VLIRIFLSIRCRVRDGWYIFKSFLKGLLGTNGMSWLLS
jgi:hypothetical protein